MNLIVGVGNTLRCDEGVGPAAVQRILTRGALPPGVEAVDAGTPGFAILDLARSARRMVVIDAMRAGGAPGTVYVVSPERVRSRGREFTESLHGVSILGALRLARAVGELLPEVCLVGVDHLRPRQVVLPVTLWAEGVDEDEIPFLIHPSLQLFPIHDRKTSHTITLPVSISLPCYLSFCSA